MIPPDRHDVPITWPTIDPDKAAPGSSYLPGTNSQATPDVATLRRVLIGLRAL